MATIIWYYENEIKPDKSNASLENKDMCQV